MYRNCIRMIALGSLFLCLGVFSSCGDGGDGDGNFPGSGNQRPQARLVLADHSIPGRVQLDATASSDPDGAIRSYQFWVMDLNDLQSVVERVRTSKPYLDLELLTGDYLAQLTVTDNSGESGNTDSELLRFSLDAPFAVGSYATCSQDGGKGGYIRNVGNAAWLNGQQVSGSEGLGGAGQPQGTYGGAGGGGWGGGGSGGGIAAGGGGGSFARQGTRTDIAAPKSYVARWGKGEVRVVFAPEPKLPRLVFLTSTQHNGNLGGVNGADSICNARAQEAGLHGTYKAWLAAGPDSSPDGMGSNLD